MFLRMIILLGFICGLNLAKSQVFTNSINYTINETGDFNEYYLDVSGLGSKLNIVNFGLESITLNISHERVSDLKIKLSDPWGRTFDIVSYEGGNGQNFTSTVFVDSATLSINKGTAPFSGIYKPIQQLSRFNTNLDCNGTWKLLIKDGATGIKGNLLNWSLKFGNKPSGLFKSSNLPIIQIYTDGQEILDEPKINVAFKVFNNDFGKRNSLIDIPEFEGTVGIEIRGSSSASFPQKSYGFETRWVNGSEQDTSLLGMPSEHDWILYAPFNDKTCLRNVLAYQLSNEMGHYASRTKYCEVFINDEYLGIYVLMEKIKRGKHRCNIAKLTSNDIKDSALTGGYIIKIDKTTGSGTSEGWNSSFTSSQSKPILFLNDYPSSKKILKIQNDYIKSYIDSFETVLKSNNFNDLENGYAKYIGAKSFMDYFIINELSRNVDGYRLSTYLHKESLKDGGKLKMGPIWDYNLAFWNADYCEGWQYTGWAYDFNEVCSFDGFQIPFWWKRLLEDPKFSQNLKCRWIELRGKTLSTSKLNNFIDSVSNVLSESYSRHFQKWTILGTYTWPNPSPIPTTVSGEINALKTWLSNRIDWLDLNMPSKCDIIGFEDDKNDDQVNVYPNPATDLINVGNFHDNGKIRVYDCVGHFLFENEMIEGKGEYKVPVDLLESGIYLFEIVTSSKSKFFKVQIVSN